MRSAGWPDPERPWSPGVGKEVFHQQEKKVGAGFKAPLKELGSELPPKDYRHLQQLRLSKIYPLAVETWKMKLGKEPRPREPSQIQSSLERMPNNTDRCGGLKTRLRLFSEPHPHQSFHFIRASILSAPPMCNTQRKAL